MKHSGLRSRVFKLKPGIGWSLKCGRFNWNGARKLVVRASGDSEVSSGSRNTAKDALKAVKGDLSAKFQGFVNSVPPLDLTVMDEISVGLV